MKLYMFRQFVCPSSGVIQCTVWTAFLVLLESCLQTCMTCTIVECTVNKLLMMDRRTIRNM